MTDKVAILLATYNGAQYLVEQLESFFSQTHKKWHLFVRDDGSSDDTLKILNSYIANNSNITLIDNMGEYTGSAAGNFFKLINCSDFYGYSYFCLSDQDDVWAPAKLQAALDLMSESGAEAYSSNLVAYDDFRKSARYINKCQREKKYDYLFQGASAGCTYVFSRSVFDLVQEKTRCIHDFKGRSHDWLIYAICRVAGVSWVFDKGAYIFYRQHENNVYGAMSAFSGAINKFKILRSGWYRENILWIGQKSGASFKDKNILDKVNRNSFIDKIKLLGIVSEFRRSKPESRLLAIIILFFF